MIAARQEADRRRDHVLALREELQQARMRLARAEWFADEPYELGGNLKEAAHLCAAPGNDVAALIADQISDILAALEAEGEVVE
jgi:hypothetical protein